MICIDLFMAIAKDNGAWLIAWIVMAPVAAFIGTSVYYRIRYREGIVWQTHFDSGLLK